MLPKVIGGECIQKELKIRSDVSDVHIEHDVPFLIHDTQIH